MRQSIFLILLLGCSKLFGQSEEVFPDYQEVTKDKNISEVVWTDEVSGNQVKTSYLENGVIRKEVYSDYKKAFSKYSIDGSFQYKYNGLTFPFERFYTNSNEDTLKVLYSYKDNKIVKREYWEYERRSKMRKGAPEYGDGKPAGCIVAEQDLIRYRKWVKDKFYSYIYNKGQLDKIQINYFRGGSPDVIISTYNEGKLTNRTELDRRKKTTNWEELYEYEGSKILMTKKYFVTYWGKIPPTEKWTTELDSFGREIKIARELDGLETKEILVRTFNEIGNIIRLSLTINESKKVFDYSVTYK